MILHLLNNVYNLPRWLLGGLIDLHTSPELGYSIEDAKVRMCTTVIDRLEPIYA